MAQTKTCPQCGAELPSDAPAELCPKCLLQAGLDDLDGDATRPGDEPTMASEPPGAVDEVSSPPFHEVAPGDTIRYFGDYELLEEIARGGMGVVFKARQVSLNRMVALKMILAGQLASEEEVQRFFIEAKAAAKLDHAGIVPIYEVGEHEGQYYFSMRYVEGPSLADKVVGGPLPPSEAAEVVMKIAEAIAFAHESGVIHRDLKPGNVLLDSGGEPRVTDFGLAKKTTGAEESGMKPLTDTGQILGTPSFMPPEQAAGDPTKIGPAADIYSLGAVLYCLLTGRPPFQAAAIMDTLMQVLEQDPISPRQLNPGVPVDLETICLECLRKEPDRRYASASALADELRRYLNGEPIQARPVGRIERLWRWCKRNPRVAGLSAALAVALIVAFFGITSQWRRAERERRMTERHLYAAHTNLAHQAWHDDNLAPVLKWLEQHRPAAGEEDLRSFEWCYLWGLCHRAVKTVKFAGGHWTALSPDGRTLAWADPGRDEWKVNLFDVAAGKLTRTLKGRQADIHFIIFSPDGRKLAWVSNEEVVRDKDGQPQERPAPRIMVWDVNSGRELAEIKGNGKVAFSPDGKRLVANDGTIWNISTGEATVQKKLPFKDDGMLAFSPDGQRTACVSGRHVTLCDTSTGEKLLLFPKGGANFVAFSPHGRFLASASSNSELIAVWDLQQVEDRASPTLTLHGRHPVGRGSEQADSIAFSSDGQSLAVACGPTVKLWNVLTGERIATLKGHTSYVSSVAFAPDGKTLVSSSGPDRTIRTWDLVGDRPDAIPAHKHRVNSVAFSPDGETIASAGRKNTVKLFNPATGEQVATLQAEKDDSLWFVAFSPDGNHLAAGGQTSVPEGPSLRRLQSQVWLWELGGGKLAATFQGDGSNVANGGAMFSPDGRKLFLAGGRAVSEFQTAGGKRRDFANDPNDWRISGADGPPLSDIYAAALFPDGRRLATMHDSYIALWEVAKGRALVILPPMSIVAPGEGSSGFAVKVSVSPDGQLLAHLHGDTVLIWDTNGLRSWSGPDEHALRATLTGHRLPVAALVFSPDGKTLATGGADGMIKIWDVVTGEERLTLQRDKGPVESRGITCLAFSPDGKQLVAGGADGVIHIYRAASEEEIRARSR